MKKWPEELHHKASDDILNHNVSELIGTIQHKTHFREMILDHLANNMFVNIDEPDSSDKNQKLIDQTTAKLEKLVNE